MTLANLDLGELAEGFTGDLVLPHEHEYDEERRLFNAMVDRRPAVIAKCRVVADVVRAVRFGRERGLGISVRGGGHGVAGAALNDGGLVIDLRFMHAVEVDPATATATVAGGATMRDLDRGAEPYGLATTGGRVSSTGVAGLTLGGGSGWLDRKYGLACDNLLAVDLVTADGDRLRASESTHPELFWALHGGGGNFGIATSFTFRLYPLLTVTAAKLLWPAEAGPEVVRAFRDIMVSAPDEIGSAFLYLTAPPADFVPSRLHGRLACAVVAVFAGAGPEAQAALAPLLALGHQGELVAEMPYADFQCLNEDPPGYRNYWSADHLDDLPDEAVDRFCAHAAEMITPSPSALVLLPQGGAVARSGHDYPIPWRLAPWHVPRFAMWDRPADDVRARSWARRLSAELRPWASGDVYLNFVGDGGPERLAAGFGAENLARLAAVKARYDPDNVFRPHHNITPGPAGEARGSSE